MTQQQETIAAIATPPGTGGIGIVRISGPAAKQIGKSLVGSIPTPRKPKLQLFLDRDCRPIDRGLVLFFAGPASYTGEDVLELHGHGGPVVLDLLIERVHARGTAMIYITHDLGIASQLSDRAYVMYAGRVVEEGPTGVVFTQPRHPYTTGLIEAVPSVTAAAFKGIPGILPDPKAIAGGCAFRWRCAYAASACGEKDPPLVSVAERQKAACLRATELALAS